MVTATTKLKDACSLDKLRFKELKITADFVTATTKLKDACSLEEKLWQT